MRQQHPQSHHRPVNIEGVWEGGRDGRRGEQMSDGGTESRQIEVGR